MSTIDYARGGRPEWVTVASYDEAGMAHLALQQLQEQDIPCSLDNENVASLLYATPALGGVRVRVLREDEDEAREILGTAIDQPLEHEAKGQEADLEEDGCLYCIKGSIEVYSWRRRVLQTIALGIVLSALPYIMLPLPLLLATGICVYYLLSKPQFRCASCGKAWNPGGKI